MPLLPSQIRFQVSFRLLSRSAGLFASGIGCLVLAGWMLDVGALKSVFPGLVAMKANTALGFVLAGVALYLFDPTSPVSRPGQWRHRLYQAYALIVALLGLLTLGEYAFGRDFGIDQALFREPPGAVGTSHPGRMALSTALDFLLLGLALLLLSARGRRVQQSVQFLTLAAALTPLLSLIGYGYGVSAFYDMGPYTPMALHTGVALIALCAGVLFTWPDMGLMRVVTGKGLGSLMARRLLPFAIGLPVGLGWLVLKMERAGIYNPDMGVSLGVTLAILSFSALVCWAAVAMSRLEGERREADARYRTLFDRSPDGVLLIDPETTLPIAYNDTACRQLGYSREEFARLCISDYEVIESIEETNTRIEKILRMGRDEFETRHCTKDGEIRNVQVIAQTIELSGRVFFYCIFRDITERKRVEEEHARLGMAVEQAAEVIVITDPDGTIVYANPAFERVTGYTREEVVGQNPRILKSGRQDAAFYRAMWDTLQKGEVWTGIFVNRRKDGELYEEEAVISPMRDATGRVIHYVAVKRDVTREKSLEAQLRQAQKMEAVGALAGGVAHDFNNILTGMIGYTQLALMEPEGSDRWREYIARVPDQGKQAAKLISQLLTFSRMSVTEKQPLSLASLAKETIKMLGRTLPENIAIRVNASAGVGMVNADPTQMQQVIMNLCVNAGHAMPNGGELIIGLENVTLDQDYCRQYLYARPGDYVCLSVRDTGVGMTPEVQARIFEPFFTTKGAGEGTGLGLATVYGIVKEHEGHINVYSEVGVGSEFKVYLPAMKEERGQQAVSAQEPLVGGTETLLMVEDDARVMEAGKKMLERLGYTILTAVDGEEGLRIYRDRRNEIALVLMDMVMPKMGGPEVYEALTEVNPGVKVVVMSGYSLKEKVADMRSKGLRGFVQKPFDFNSLGRTVRQVLDEQRTDLPS